MTRHLTSKELLCVATLLKVPEVVGIPGAFQSATPDRLREELRETQEALEHKGLLTLDFEGNSTLMPTYRPLLETVLKGEKAAILDAQTTGRGKESVIYYLSGEKTVRSVSQNGGFELTDLPAVQAAEELQGRIQWERGEVLSCTPLLVSQKQLDQLRVSAPSEMVQRLAADSRLAAILTDALRFKSSYYSLALLDRGNGGRLRSFILIDDPRGTLRLISTVEGEESCILIRAVDREDLRLELAGAIRELFQAGRER